MRDTDITWEDKSVMSAMVPKGLAAAVLAGLPLQYGIPEGSEIQIIVYNVVFVSILTTSVLIPLIRTRFISRFYRVFFRPIPKLDAISIAKCKADKVDSESIIENKEGEL